MLSCEQVGDMGTDCCWCLTSEDGGFEGCNASVSLMGDRASIKGRS